MGFVLGFLIWAITIGTVVLTAGSGYHLPAVISKAGAMIDHQFGLTMAVTGVAFILAQGLLGLFVLQYRERGRAVRYVHGNTAVEAAGAIVIGVVFIVLAVMGQKVWAGLHLAPAAAGTMPIEIMGEQFAWNVRYPGKDGILGRTDFKLASQDNLIGLDPNDPAGKDDLLLLNQLYLPKDRAIRVRIRSADVIHSFFLPNFRVKQDAMPGMVSEVWFTAKELTPADKPLEIACAEHCGLGHYRMRGKVHVVAASDFDRALTEAATQ